MPTMEPASASELPSETPKQKSDVPAAAPPAKDERPTVFLVHDERVTAHTSNWAHIETAVRAQLAVAHLKRAGLLEQCVPLVGRLATDEELLTAHRQRHIDEVARLSRLARDNPNSRELREPDGAGGVYYSAAADEAARIASGCVVDAATAVLEHPRAAAFAIVRPPGHHAGADDTDGHRAEGFCFYNSIAVAAGSALRSGRARRVMIIDWDVHHGNGTQQIFFDEPRVLCVSLHRAYDGKRWTYPAPNKSNPRTGAVDEVGGAGAEGRNVNVAWPESKLHDDDYAAAWELLVLPLARAHAPDLLLVAAGFDSAEGEVQGDLRLTPQGFGRLAGRLLALGVPTAFALEGGYNPPVTAACCEAVLRAALGDVPPPPPRPQRPSSCTEPTLAAVMAAHAPHWPAVCGEAARAALPEYFRRAAQDCAPERASKRRRASVDEEGLWSLS